MRLSIFSKNFSLSHYRAIGALVASAVVMNLCAFAPIPARSAQPATGLAYDEVTKVVLGGGTPEPGTFTADFESAVGAQRSAGAPGSHRGLFGGIMNTIDMAKSGLSLLKSGTASSKYYLAGWERTDDPGAQTSTIYRPQLHQVIYLNLAKKTYRIVDTNAREENETPPPMERARAAGGQPAQPGSGKLDVTVSNTLLGPRVIENISTTGYKVTFNLTESQSTGSCSDGSFQTSMVEYVSRYSQPHVAADRVAVRRALSTRPELMALKPGCTPKIFMHTSGGSQPASGRLSLWTLVGISANAPTAQGQMSGGFSTLIERGNIRGLGPADKSLFDIPAGFTKEQ